MTNTWTDALGVVLLVLFTIGLFRLSRQAPSGGRKRTLLLLLGPLAVLGFGVVNKVAVLGWRVVLMVLLFGILALLLAWAQRSWSKTEGP